MTETLEKDEGTETQEETLTTRRDRDVSVVGDRDDDEKTHR